MILTIAGYGFVGKAYYNALNKYNMHIVDPIINDERVHTNKTNGVIICVSTPIGSSGACNYNNIVNVLLDTPDHVPVLIKSTISLEGWDYITKSFPNHEITFSPEYLREASYLEDFKNAATIFIGGGDLKFWKRLFGQAFPDKYISIAEPKELILAKYFINSFLATKVSFFNQVYDLCSATNVDYSSVVKLITHDARIGESHTQITPERGFGGHCFPKDTAAIIYTAKQYDVKLSIIAKVKTYNNSIRITKK